MAWTDVGNGYLTEDGTWIPYQGGEYREGNRLYLPASVP